ncbi:HAA1 [[Candida] subhashii]|uniref:HAA1 n=1 Tax=[Candida] subhashii TaxID=561895 RepID=A0A8J5QIW3_9ASCO|nr:HAA1 [[Candida] subhashii]KAG7661792.1 HAA1 [[Candida] subhashii]
MVLINGIKYACERCIRGHRVTTCTHTDQPLTMIKPKGRPATQCQHCRDQRKMKNLHTTCTCGKKGKSPGTHLASCLCHKNAHCTCSNKPPTTKTSTTNGNIHHMSASERAKKKSLIDAANADIKKKSTSPSTTASIKSQQSSPYPSISNNFVIEDIVLPFETGNGLFDLFSNSGAHSDGDFGSGSQASTPASNINNPNLEAANSTNTTNPNLQGFDKEPIINNPSRDIRFNEGSAVNPNSNKRADIIFNNSANNNNFPGENNNNNNIDNQSITSHLSPTDMDLVDNMFPLFPLVGSQSFDTENQPLSLLPPTGSDRSQPIPTPTQTKATQHPRPIRPSVNTQTANPIIPSSSVNSMNSVNTANTSNYTSTFQATKLKRPESVLSIASNSSSRSFDVIGQGYANHSSSFISGGGGFQTSSAYPPSNPFHDSTQPQSATSEENPHTHHFGRTGLGSSNIGTQLSKIESELYTESFFDEAIENNNGQQQLSASSSIPNFYSVGTGGGGEGSVTGGIGGSNGGGGNSNNAVNGSVSDLTYHNQNGSMSDLTFDKNIPNPLDYDIPLYQEMFTPLTSNKASHPFYQAQPDQQSQQQQQQQQQMNQNDFSEDENYRESNHHN